MPEFQEAQSQIVSASICINLCQFAMQLLCSWWKSNWSLSKTQDSVHLTWPQVDGYALRTASKRMQADRAGSSNLRLCQTAQIPSAVNIDKLWPCAVMCSHAKAKMAQEIVLAAVKQNGKASTRWTVMEPDGIVRQPITSKVRWNGWNVRCDVLFDVMFRQVWARSKQSNRFVWLVLWNSVALNEGVGLRAWRAAKGPRGSSCATQRAQHQLLIAAGRLGSCPPEWQGKAAFF